MRYDQNLAARVPQQHHVGAFVVSGVGLLLIIIAAPYFAHQAAAALAHLVPADARDLVFKHGVYQVEHALHAVAVIVSVALALFVTGHRNKSALRRAAGVVSSGVGAFRWRLFGASTLIAIPILGGAVVVDVLRHGPMTWDPTPAAGVTLLFALVLYPLQAAGQEYLFRAWPLVHARLLHNKTWCVTFAMVASTVAFTLNHTRTPDLLMLDIFAFALIMWWVTAKVGGIEAAIALHMVTNFAMAAASTLTTKGVTFEAGGVSGDVAMGVALDVCSMAGAAFCVVLYARKMTNGTSPK